MNKLVVKEFTQEQMESIVIPAGYRYSYFYDEQTGKYFRPKSSFEVTGEKLEELFEEVAVDLGEEPVKN